MNAIEVRGLVKDYPAHRGLRQTLRRPFNGPKTRVLDGLDLNVASGEVVGILGANGAGKTTLLKVLATLVRPNGGEAFVKGFDVVVQEREARAVCSYAFGEERSFYWRLTGRQNLEFFAALNDIHGSAAQRMIDDLAERLGVASYLDQPYSFYSAGIRHRMSIVRSLLRHPKVLLLDEPTRSVDPASARELWSLVRDVLVAQAGMTVLLVTHQAEEAAAVCDRIAIMADGRLQNELRPAELRVAADGLRGLTITLDGFRAAELARLRTIRGVREVTLSQIDGEQQLEVWCENGDLALSELIAVTTAGGATVRALNQATPVSAVVARLLQQRNGHAG
jgi:ABC-2 type transport system ATP-binding protein